MSTGPLSAQALFAQYGPVQVLVLDQTLRQHLAARGTYAKHRVSPREVRPVHVGQPRYFVNVGPGRAAPAMMIGPTAVGRLLAVPIQPAGRYGVWRAATAFEANRHDRSRYYGSRP